MNKGTDITIAILEYKSLTYIEHYINNNGYYKVELKCCMNIVFRAHRH